MPSTEPSFFNHTKVTSESTPKENGPYEIHWQHQLALTFNFWSLGVLIPVIAISGVLANAASVIVLTRRSMRSSPINIYLASLSTFDGLLLLMTLLLYPPLSYCELDHSNPSSPWCQYFFRSALLTYPLSLIMQSGSVWTLTAITIDRFIAVTWPLHSRDWCTSRRAYWVIVILSLWSLLYNLPAFFELQWVELLSSEFVTDHDLALENSTFSRTETKSIESAAASQIVLAATSLREDPDYIIAYKGYCYLIFMLLLPAGTMIILNVFVTISVRRAYRLRKAMSGREEKERRCTIMAILVVATFLVLNSLAFINNLFEIFASSNSGSSSATGQDDDPVNCTGDPGQDRDESSGRKSPAFLVLVTVGNVMVALNSATNFFIYCALGLRFRRMFCKIFCRRSCGESFLSAINTEKSYQSLTVRYGTYGTTPANKKKLSDPENGFVASPPVPPARSRSLLVECSMDQLSNAMTFQTLESCYSISPNHSRTARIGNAKDGSFV